MVKRWGKFVLILYLCIVHLLAFLFVLEKVNSRRSKAGDAALMHLVDSTIQRKDTMQLSGQYAVDGDTSKLLIPVVGIKKTDLQDTYTQSRAGDRVHNAIDIMAAGGTPVVAVADGEVAKFFDSKLGGTTIYQWSADHQRIYYYAHLQSRADGLREKSFIKRGTVIGYVGDSGDAGPGNYHLHFSISIPTSADHYWGGTDINPYPILMHGIEVPALRE